MGLVRCKLGYAETRVGDVVYTFERDRAGRWVCDINIPSHYDCFKDLDAYEYVEPLEDVMPPGHPRTSAPAPGTGDPGSAAALAARSEAELAAQREANAAAGMGAPPADVPAGETGGADDLTEIKGIGPKAAEKLAAMGLTTFEQIAALDVETIENLNKSFKPAGQVSRNQWVDQAQKLVADRNAAGE